MKTPRDEMIFPEDAYRKHIRQEEIRKPKAEKIMKKPTYKLLVLIFILITVLIVLSFMSFSRIKEEPTFTGEEVSISADRFRLVSGGYITYINVSKEGSFKVYILSDWSSRFNSYLLDDQELESKIYGAEPLYVNYGMLDLEPGSHLLAVEVPTDSLLEDYSFEDRSILEGTAWRKVGDCCDSSDGEPAIEASLVEEPGRGRVLRLESNNHCACTSQQMTGFKPGKYHFSIDYKGSNPKLCIWNYGCNECSPVIELDSTDTWKESSLVFETKNCTTNLAVFLYANSDGTNKVSNSYDDAELIPFLPGVYEVVLSSTGRSSS